MGVTDQGIAERADTWDWDGGREVQKVSAPEWQAVGTRVWTASRSRSAIGSTVLSAPRAPLSLRSLFLISSSYPSPFIPPVSDFAGKIYSRNLF